MRLGPAATLDRMSVAEPPSRSPPLLCWRAAGDDGGVRGGLLRHRPHVRRRTTRRRCSTATTRPTRPAAAELLRGAGARLRAWAAQAPGEVDDDVEAIAEVADELAVGFESPPPSPDRAAELEASFSEVEAASARVTAYARERCAVELDPAAAHRPGAGADTDKPP